MSFETLEYPLKLWITSIIDDAQIKSDLFDLLGNPNLEMRYSSLLLYTVENLVKHDAHNLVVKLKVVDENYKFDLGAFSVCNTISSQLISILKESDAVLKYIIGHVERKYIDMFDLDKLSVKLENGMRLVLHYDGKDVNIKKNVAAAPNYGFVTSIVYDDDAESGSDHDASQDSESDGDGDDLKNILDELVAENLQT